MTDLKISKGDVVYLEFDGWIVSPDGKLELFDTTNEELSKKENIYKEKKIYGEIPVLVGANRLFQGLDEAIIESQAGEERELEIPPEKAGGARDPKLVELHSIREFIKQEINPEVGMEVAIRGKRGIITAVTAGRVRVDFNNPLAGKVLKYRYKVTKKAQTLEERILGILEMDYGMGEHFKIDVKGDEVDIVIPDVCKTDEAWFVSKFRAVADLREYGGARKIRFIEEYEKKEEKKEEKKGEVPAEAGDAVKGEKKTEEGEQKRKPRKAAHMEKEEKAPEEL